MPARTNIHWADYQSNMLVSIRREEQGRDYSTNGKHEGHACVRVSPGCEHCWASAFNTRLGTGLAYTAQNMKLVNVEISENELRRIAKFKPRPRKGESAFKWGRSRAAVFPCDMTDMFGEWVTDEMLDRMFEAMCARADVDWMVLTKRVERMEQYVMYRKGRGLDAPLLNVYLGCTVEDDKRSFEQINPMRRMSFLGWKTFVSYEPALSLIDWNQWWFLQWLICGGESGTQARPMHPDWARGARDFCKARNIPYFFKQWGEWTPFDHLAWATDMTTLKHKPINWGGTVLCRVGTGLAGRVLDGEEWSGVAR